MYYTILVSALRLTGLSVRHHQPSKDAVLLEGSVVFVLFYSFTLTYSARLHAVAVTLVLWHSLVSYSSVLAPQVRDTTLAISSVLNSIIRA